METGGGGLIKTLISGFLGRMAIGGGRVPMAIYMCRCAACDDGRPAAG